MGYFNNAVRGISWMGSLRASTRIIAYIKIAILARILVPEQFGIFGIASLLLAFLETFTETGINIFFIQGEGKLKDYVDTAWIVSIFRGILITALILLFAPVIAGFFREPDAVFIIYLMASVPFIRAFINPSVVKFKMELEFRKEFLFRTFTFFADALVAIVLALIIKSPSALVYGMAAGAFTEVVLSFLVFKPRPKFKFEIGKVRKVIGRGKWIAIGQTSALAFKEGDDVLVGRLLDTFSLGIYQIAYKISTLPLTEAGWVINSVAFPIYSKIAGDINRLRRAYLRVLVVVFLVTAPVGVVFYIFPEIIIKILLGPNWIEAVPVLRVLATFGVLRAVGSTTTALYHSKKKQEYVAVVSTVSFLGMAITIVPFIRSYGVIGAAYSALVGLFVGMIVDIYLLIRVFRKGSLRV